MPNYQLQAPDGNTYTVAGPPGASQEQVQAEVLKQHPTAGQARKAQRSESYSERVKRTGDTLDKTLTRRGNALDTAGNIAGGAIETALAVGTGVVGDVAGAATSLATRDASRGARVRNALTYRPETPSGRAGADYFAALTQPIARLAGTPARKLEEHGFPIAAQTVQAMIDVAPGVPKALRPAATAARDAARTIALGFHLRPTDMGSGLAARATQAAVGGDEMAKAFSVKNQPVSTSLIAQELRLPPTTKVTPKVLDDVKVRENAVYKQMAAMGTLPIPPGARLNIRNIGTGRKLAPEAQAFKAQYSNLQAIDANRALDLMDSLRTDASASFKSGKRDLGMAQRAVADQLYSVLSLRAFELAKKGLVPADLGPQFGRARRTLAQVRDIRKALIPGSGEVSAKKLGAIEDKAMKAGRPHFTGNLKIVADSALRYPEVFQDGPKIQRAGTRIGIKGLGIGAMEVGLGYYHPAVAATVAGVAAARPLVRKAMGTRPVQRGMAAKAAAPKGDLGRTRAVGAAGVAGQQANKKREDE